MENQIFRDVNTFLDINGPVLSFTTHPTGVTGIGTTAGTTGGGTVELTGIATVSFIDDSAVNLGSISYQWYEQGVGKVSNGTYITGAATTTLTLSNLITPDDNQRKFYLQADYIPNPQSGIGYSSGNAWNEPLNSGIGTVTVTPMLEIIAQPSSSQAPVNTNRTFTVNAGLTDNTYTDDLQYQWIVDGVEVSDGTSAKTTTTGVDVFGDVSNTYTSDASHTVPAAATNVRVTLAGAQGGDGGSDAGGPGGRGGQGRIGTLTLTTGNERKLEFKIGKRGNGGSSGGHAAFGSGGAGISGGRGGGAGQNGWSGGGGGGGGATGVKDTNLSSNYIGIAGGGGGGGGGSLDRGAPSAYNTQARVGFGFGGGSYPTFLPARPGSAGATKSGDGGGGGGGAGGANISHPAPGGPSGGSGGGAGQDRSHGGTPGYGGVSGYNNAQASFSTGSGTLNEGDGYAQINYRGYSSKRVVTTRNTVISGSQTKTLTIKSNLVGVQTAVCRISSATASNSPILTDQVNFAVLDTVQDSVINIEEIGITDTANLSTINLVNGEYTFNLGVQDGGSTSAEYYVLYSPDRDVEVEMDLYGGKGEEDTLGGGDPNAKTETGEGGYSRIQFTLEQNVEYVIAGLTKDIQAPFLYRKGGLMAVVGGGGGGGYFSSGRGGGDGGGINVAGEDGKGQGGGGGKGAALIPQGTLNADGIFGSVYSHPIILTQGVSAMQQILHAGDSYAEGREGGRATKCSKGEYWAQQGKGSCDDLGNIKFRLSSGTEVTNTSDSITRGFKAGYPIIATAGKGMGRGVNYHQQSKGGHGGNGATGGQGGQLAGGGGGSGYTDGSVTVIDTMQGGSTGDAKVVLRVVSD